MKLEHFTPEQIKELQEIFGLTPIKSDFSWVKIRDGFVDVSEPVDVWWRYEGGPELVKADAHRDNIKRYPELYSFVKPKYTSSIVYQD